ncbi:MAG: ATPase, T2SS/T4P/T4SS family [Lentimonas sp.]
MDIHVEPKKDVTNICFRIAGRLRNVFVVASALHPPITSRIKILSELDMAETRFPQDGRFFLSLCTESVNFRISLIPTVTGEKMALRILALTGKRDFRSFDQMLSRSLFYKHSSE